MEHRSPPKTTTETSREMGVAAVDSDSLEVCGIRINADRDVPSGCGRKISATGKFPTRRISANRTFPLGCGRNASFVTAEMNPSAETVSNDAKQVREKVLRRKISATVKLPRRSISVNRRFPPGCGRKASFVTAEMNPSAGTVRDDAKQVREKVLDQDPPSIGLKENIVKYMVDKVELEFEGDVGKEEHVQVSTAPDGNLEPEDPQKTSVRLDWESNLYQPQSKSQSAIENVKGNVGNLKGEMGRESVELCKKSLKRTFPEDAINKRPREPIDLTASGNKLPGQPSMAALNFARIHGEHSLTSNLVSSSSGNNVRRHELMVKTALGPSNNRVIVQALMAAPSCPWRQGRRRIKGNLTYIEKQCRKA